MNTTDLTKYTKAGYTPGRGFVIRALWYCANYMVFMSPFPFCNGVKRLLIRMFGAKVGKGVVIKPRVNIKYPWLLSVGDNSWIGEEVWIDNLAQVSVGKNCCLSQRVLIETGSHDYSKSDFRLRVAPVTIDDGVWICAGAVLTAGAVCRSHSVLAAGSVANGELLPYSVYKGNPAEKVRERLIDD